MNELGWWIYLASVFDGLKSMFIVSGLVGIPLTMICFSAMIETYDVEEAWEKVKKYFIGFILLVFASLFVPTQKTMYYILGAKITENTLETPEMIKLRKIINDKLEEFDDE